MPSIEPGDAAVCCSGQLQVNCHGFPALKFQRVESEIQLNATKTRQVALHVVLVAANYVLLEWLKIEELMKINFLRDLETL